MTSRRLPAVLLASMLAFGMTGCIGAADAKPSASKSASAFKSDAEAYAAAEKVYRDYVDALNHVDLADPKTFEPVFALTTGPANAADRKSFSQMHADHWKVGGTTRITLVAPGGPVDDKISLDVCTDLTTITLTDPTGASMVSPDRSPTQSRVIVLVETPAGLRINAFHRRDKGPACGEG